MEFLKIISDDSSIEIIPLNQIFSIRVVMGKLYINGESKHLKVKNSEEFLNGYISLIAAERTVFKYGNSADILDLNLRCLCIENADGYAYLSVNNINIK